MKTTQDLEGNESSKTTEEEEQGIYDYPRNTLGTIWIMSTQKGPKVDYFFFFFLTYTIYIM